MIGAAAIASVLLALTVAMAAANDDDERRARIACMGGWAELVLRADERDDDDDDDDDGGGGISIDLRVDASRPIAVWRIVLVHERRLLVQTTRRPRRPRSSLRLTRRVPDWPGRQTVAARVTNGAGGACRPTATI